MLEGYTLSAETEAPVLSVTVLGESCTPPLSAARDGRESEIPIVGTRSKSAAAQQESYDSFEAGRLPAVRNQAPYGSCWAFGTIGAMEADLITDGAGTDIDLSELHLAYYGYHGFYDENLIAADCTALTELSCSDCPLLETLNIRNCPELYTLECCNDRLSSLDLSDCEWLGNLTCYGNRIQVLDVIPTFILSGIIEYYPPVFGDGIVSYPYEGHKIAFDENVILINVEPDFLLPENLKAVGEEAFLGCTFQYALLSGRIESIGKRAFADCPNLDFVRILAKDVEIDGQAFEDRSDVVILAIPGGAVEAFAQAHGFLFAPIG